MNSTKGAGLRAADWSKHPVVVLGAFLASVLAVVLSVIGVKQSGEAASEQRAIEVQGVATANQLLRTNEGLGLLVSLTNASLRPLILRDAILLLDGRRIGRANRYLANATVLARIQLDPGRVVGNTQSLPLTLGARDGRTLGLFIDDQAERPIFIGPPNGRGPRRTTFRTWDRVLSGEEPARRHRIILRVTFAPRVVKRITVQVEPAMTAAFAWQEAISPLRPSAVSMGLRRKAGEPGQGDVFRLDVWSRRGRTHRVYERPLIANDWTDVIVRGLPNGEYLYTFRIRSEAVVTGCMRFPAHDGDPYC
jgi:hypothetical protein